MVSVSPLKGRKMWSKLESCSEGGLTNETLNGFALLEQANLSLQKENEWLKNELKGQIESVAIHKDIVENENKILRLKNRLLEIKYASDLNKHQLELEKLRNSFNVSKLQVLAAPPPPVKPAPPDFVFPTIPIGTKSWSSKTTVKTGGVTKSYFSSLAGVNSGNASKVRVEVESLHTSSNNPSTLLTDTDLTNFIPARILAQSPTLNLLPPCRPPTKAESSPETRTGSSAGSTTSTTKTESALQLKTETYLEGNRELSHKKRRNIVDGQRHVNDGSSSKTTPKSPQEICDIEEKIQKEEVIANDRATKTSQGGKPNEESEILANLTILFDEPGMLNKRKPRKVKANVSKKRKKNDESKLDEKRRKKSKKSSTCNLCTTMKEKQEKDTSYARKENTNDLKLSQLRKNGAIVPAAKLSANEVATKNIQSAASIIQSDEKQEALTLNESDSKKSDPVVSTASDSVDIPTGLPPPNEVFPKSKLLSEVLSSPKSPPKFCPSGGPLKPPTADTIKPLRRPGKSYINALATLPPHGLLQQPPTQTFVTSVVPKRGARPFIPPAAPTTGLSPPARKKK